MKLIASMLATSLLAHAASVPPPLLINEPAVVIKGATDEPRLASFQPGEPRCGGTTQSVIHRELAIPSAAFGLPAASQPVEVRLSFRISAEGRPLGIVSAKPMPVVYMADARDVIPAFAAWRFAPGAARENCEISFAVMTAPVREVEMDTVYRFLVLGSPASRGNPLLMRAAFERTHPAGSTCMRPPPAVRQRAFPAFETIPQLPGTLSYSMVAFDIGATGKPINVKLVGSGGNPELDRQSVEAVAKSRFAPQERRGCTYPYWRTPTEPLAAPDSPEEATFKSPESNCPEDVAAFSAIPPLVFPAEFRRRNIEGWAIVRYDLAPWGAVGNVSVAAAEPAVVFGERAKAIVQEAKKPESPNGYRGCVVRVRFKLPEELSPVEG